MQRTLGRYCHLESGGFIALVEEVQPPESGNLPCGMNERQVIYFPWYDVLCEDYVPLVFRYACGGPVYWDGHQTFLH